MMPRRASTTGPESFRSWASSRRTRLERPPAREGAWAVGPSMGDTGFSKRSRTLTEGRPGGKHSFPKLSWERWSVAARAHRRPEARQRIKARWRPGVSLFRGRHGGGADV